MRHTVIRTVGAMILVVAASAVAAAVPLDEYRRRVGEAVLVAEALAVTESPPTDYGVELAVEHLKELLPSRETVEFGGDSYPVENAWLERDLARYVQSDRDKRGEIGSNIHVRLQGLEQNLDALGADEAVDAGSARERLARILERSEFKEHADDEITKLVRKVREALLQALLWLREKIFGDERTSAIGSGIRSLILVIGVVAFVLLVRMAYLRIRIREATAKPEARKTVLGETIEAGVTAAHLATQARQLAGKGDYRGAIRKLFVALLYDLDERKVVRLEADATNREYLAHIRALGRLYPVMLRMTDTFERVWYGGAEAGASDFAAFDTEFAEALRVVGERSGVAG
jgi:hypothetical protein